MGLKLQSPEVTDRQLQILAVLTVRDVRVGTEGKVKTQKRILVLRDFLEDAVKGNKKLKFTLVLSHFSLASLPRNQTWVS